MNTTRRELIYIILLIVFASLWALNSVHKHNKHNEQNLFKEATKDNTVFAYRNFLKKYPNNKKAIEIGIEKEWEEAQKENSIQAYRKYLDRYHNSKYVDDVHKRIKLLEAGIDLEIIFSETPDETLATRVDLETDGILKSLYVMPKDIKEVLDDMAVRRKASTNQ